MRRTKLAAAAVADQFTKAKVLAGSGLVRPYSPVTLARLGATLARWGIGPAGGFETLALRNPDGVGLVDEIGSLTFAEIDERGRRAADSLRQMGVEAGDGVAIMVRNHRGFFDASLGASRLGADMLYLNTAFAKPQLVEVLDRESPTVLVYDEEFAELASGVDDSIKRVVAWHAEGAEDSDVPTLESLIEKGSPSSDLPAPKKKSRIIILTSGTTGTPKGAPRDGVGIDAFVSLLSRIPLRRGWKVHVAAPLFHTWGFAHMMLAIGLEWTLVLRRKFDPEDCLKTVDEQGCDALIVIPVMLQRIMKLDEGVRGSYDLSGVKVVSASGSALPGDLGLNWMDQFGDHLYNTYGSTEVAYATVADPEDLRAAPGTAGRTPHGTTVRIYDEDGDPVEDGESGRIFVGNGILFEGYTGGGSKDMIDGLMSSGDVGRFDEDGRLFVEGRDDEMIVSGGENVFPQEVEDCLTRHDAVHEAAAIGVDDEDYGKRLKAFVVLADGQDASEDDLKAHVKSNLARYKVPREIVFLDELPRNATGKVLKRELAEDGGDGGDGGDGDDEPTSEAESGSQSESGSQKQGDTVDA